MCFGGLTLEWLLEVSGDVDVLKAKVRFVELAIAKVVSLLR